MNAIEFLSIKQGGTTEVIGRAELQADGTVQLIGLPESVQRTLEEGIFGIPAWGRVYPEDGRKFLRACVLQFTNPYLFVRMVHSVAPA